MSCELENRECQRGVFPASIGLLVFWAIANGEGITRQLDAEFEKVARRGLKQLSLRIIGVGCLLSGAILMASFPTELGAVPPRSLFFWSQGLLVTGAGVNLWLILKLLRS